MTNRVSRLYSVELRELDGEMNVIQGQAVVFDAESDMGWFIETIDRHAFDSTDMSDVVLNFNHNNDLVLAGTRNGSLQLNVRDNGVYVPRGEIIDTTTGRDVLKLVRSGLISKMSFCFAIADGGERWEERNGREYRTITNIERLFDVSLVTFPAYPQTSAYLARSNDDLAEIHKALMQRRKAQDERMKELFDGKDFIK